MKQILRVADHPEAKVDRTDARQLAKDLLPNATYQALLRELQKLEPYVPPYDPEKNNVEAIKFRSAQHQIFTNLINFMRGI